MAKIPQEDIDAIKRDWDLKALAEYYGIALKKKGSNWAGLCPFHKEKTPSFTINPRTRLWHCFGCNAGGDAIGFVSKKEGIGFREAVAKLSGKKPATVPQYAQAPKPDPKAADHRLLNRVVSFYHQSFCEDPKAQEYLAKRGLTDKAMLADFKIGYSNGTLCNTIAEEGEVFTGLKKLGILNEKGKELLYGCAVFPILDDNLDCVGLYGRRITEGEIKHLYLPGPRRGVFNRQAAKRSRSLILTESIIDALTLYNAGFTETIPCYGVHGLTEDHLELFERNLTKDVFICFDADKAGEQGALKIAGQLKEKGIQARLLHLPGEPKAKADLNSFFLSTAEAPAVFEKLLVQTDPRTSLKSHKLARQEQKQYEKTDLGFLVQYGQRQYEAKGITLESTRLKVTLKASLATGQQGALKQQFHLDSVDLYSSRSRQLFAKACAILFGEEEDLVIQDMVKLIELAEAYKPEPQPKDQIQPLTKAEEDDALEFLKDPGLLKRILEDFETVGYTGEEGNKLMAYLSAVSRKLDEPLSVLIQSRSAAGKSSLQDAVLAFVPPEDFIKYTRLTGQALFYKEENSLVHKLMAIEEEQGAKEASYSIRNIQSAKVLTIAATGKDPVSGKLRTEEYKVKGPVALMITTTAVELDYETSNRFITLTIDESKEMTERILAKQRQRDTLEGLVSHAHTEAAAKRHHNAQRLLRPLKVINPYAPYLTFPAESLRARRDHKKYLGLMKTIAFLHQYQRPLKTLALSSGEVLEYIEVNLTDIQKANSLAVEIFGRSLDELSPPSKELLKLINEMVQTRCKEKGLKAHEYSFTRKDVRDWCRWSDFQIRCHIKQLEDLEYLYSGTGKRGKEYTYELLYSASPEDPFAIGLTSIGQLKKRVSESKDLKVSEAPARHSLQTA